MSENQFYIPHLEWESINFPLDISDIRFTNQEYSFSSDTKNSNLENS